MSLVGEFSEIGWPARDIRNHVIAHRGASARSGANADAATQRGVQLRLRSGGADDGFNLAQLVGLPGIDAAHLVKVREARARIAETDSRHVARTLDVEHGALEKLRVVRDEALQLEGLPVEQPVRQLRRASVS